MPGPRRLSHHISEGDGIAIIVCVEDAGGARDAEEQGAKALAISSAITGIREATSLPLLWIGRGVPAEADAVMIRPDDEHEHGQLESVVDVRDEEELELALDRLDPEIFLLTAGEVDDDVDPLDAVLELLPDVPAGKLAIAQVDVENRDEVLALERAGIDAVLVSAGDVTRPRRPPAGRRLTRPSIFGATMGALVRGLLTFSLLLGLCALLATGCSGGAKKAAAAPAVAPKPHCPGRAGWQKLANRIKAPVYCPGWLPDPLVGKLGGQWNNINSVSPDRSYLESFVWQETGGGAAGGELHVNLRAYPGRTTIPTCRTGGVDSRNVPCFDQPTQSITENGIKTRLYTVNQDADQWHAALVWRANGNLYTLSEHVAPPLTFDHVVRYLKQELKALVRINPAA